MQITGSPLTTAMHAKTPASGAIAAANRSVAGSLGGVNAEGGASEAGGGGLAVGRETPEERGTVKRGKARVAPHLGQNVDMFV